MEKFDARGNPLIRHDLKFDVTPAPLPESARGERPSSALQEAEVMRLDRILQKMKKAEQKIYAIEKAKLRLEKELKEVQKKWFPWEREERAGAEDCRKTAGTEESTGDPKRDSQNAGI